jgi:transposase-like protein
VSKRESTLNVSDPSYVEKKANEYVKATREGYAHLGDVRPGWDDVHEAYLAGAYDFGKEESPSKVAPMPLSEWVEEKADDLCKDIETHVDVYTRDYLDTEDQDSLVRLIMMSVRNWTDDRRLTLTDEALNTKVEQVANKVLDTHALTMAKLAQLEHQLSLPKVPQPEEIRELNRRIAELERENAEAREMIREALDEFVNELTWTTRASRFLGGKE